MLRGSQPQSPPLQAVAAANTAATPMATTAPFAAAGTFAQDQDTTIPTQDQTLPVHAGSKRKAESQDNERLSKRLSLLNLEQNGSKLYVPVENPSVASCQPTAVPGLEDAIRPQPSPASGDAEDLMQLDDSKHKVYIYNIDDELSSDDEAGSGTDDGRLVFLPDIEKHLKATRIPPQILANSEGELAGMQMVLYNDPKSLSVPEDKDSVRKAILEARHRLREKQKQDMDGNMTAPVGDATMVPEPLAEPSQDAPPNEFDPEAMDMD